MRRLTALLCLLSFMCAPGCRTAPVPIPEVPEVPSWRGVADHCNIDRTARLVTCGLDYFSTEARLCIDHFESTRAYSRDLDACAAERALDGDVAASRLSDCKVKLESPWRSPWLWAVIGLVAGGAVGVGIGVGAE